MEEVFRGLFSALLMGDIDKTKQYYTKDMLEGDDLSRMIVGILINEKIISEEKLKAYEDEFIKIKNDMLINELKTLRKI